MNPLDYSVWDILQELVYEGRNKPYANLHCESIKTKMERANNNGLFCSEKDM